MLLRGCWDVQPTSLARLLALSRPSSHLTLRPLCARQALCSSLVCPYHRLLPPRQAWRPTATTTTSRTVSAPFEAGTIGRLPGSIAPGVCSASQPRARFSQLTLCGRLYARSPSSHATGFRQAVLRCRHLRAARHRRWGYGGGWRRLGEQRRQRRRARQPLPGRLSGSLCGRLQAEPRVSK